LLWPINFSPLALSAKKQRNREVFYKKDMKVSTWVGQRIYNTDRVVVEAFLCLKLHFPFNLRLSIEILLEAH
jgi:hypothetical protein